MHRPYMVAADEAPPATAPAPLIVPGDLIEGVKTPLGALVSTGIALLGYLYGSPVMSGVLLVSGLGAAAYARAQPANASADIMGQKFGYAIYGKFAIEIGMPLTLGALACLAKEKHDEKKHKGSHK